MKNNFCNHVPMIMFQVWGWLHDHSEDQEQLQCEGGGSILQQELPWGRAEGKFRLITGSLNQKLTVKEPRNPAHCPSPVFTLWVQVSKCVQNVYFN